MIGMSNVEIILYRYIYSMLIDILICFIVWNCEYHTIKLPNCDNLDFYFWNLLLIRIRNLFTEYFFVGSELSVISWDAKVKAIVISVCGNKYIKIDNVHIV